jgi:hypothetical protein
VNRLRGDGGFERGSRGRGGEGTGWEGLDDPREVLVALNLDEDLYDGFSNAVFSGIGYVDSLSSSKKRLTNRS